MIKLLSFCFLSSVLAKRHFFEDFTTDTLSSSWTRSTDPAFTGSFQYNQDSQSIYTANNSSFFAISAPLAAPFTTLGSPLVLQYSVKFPQNIDCGGGYLKLLPSATDLSSFNGDTPYSVMFGPDICADKKRTHVIIGYKGKSYMVKEELEVIQDRIAHLYTLIIRPDGTVSFLLDNKQSWNGSIGADWDIFGEKMIVDPTSTKPVDWVDEEFIRDPKATKPADWKEEPEKIADPKSVKPVDWDEEVDGKWEPMMIVNPKYKKWEPSLVSNPKYKGPWKAKKMLNPDYEEDKEAYHFNIEAVGIDIWQVRSGTIYDDIMVTDSIEQAAEYAIDVFLPFQEKDAEADRLKEIADYERPIEERKKKNAEAQAKMDKNASGESKQKQQESTPGKKKKRDSMPAAGHVNEKKPNAKKKFPVKDRKVDQDKKKKKFNGPSSRGLAPNEEILIASELREEL